MIWLGESSRQDTVCAESLPVPLLQHKDQRTGAEDALRDDVTGDV